MTRQEPPPIQRRRQCIRWLARRVAAGVLTAAVFLAVTWALLSLLMELAS